MSKKNIFIYKMWRRGSRRFRKGKKKSRTGGINHVIHGDHNHHHIQYHSSSVNVTARDAEERRKWVNGLEETIVRHSQPRRCDISDSYIPTLEDFDKKLVEADAYLQILINQESELVSKIDKCEDEEEKAKYDGLKSSAANLLESIKQSIVLLQLAKNAVNPMNGVIASENYEEDNYAEKNTARSKSSGAASDPIISSSSPQLHISPPVSPTRVTHHLSAQVPALSYSSSDDEDFYDADEYLLYEESSQWDSARDSPVPEIDTQNIEVKSPDAVTATKMYDEDEDDEELDCGKHGSVITHLLSQVRIGMDLTKVVLPTFILERRSLLEMFADFFAHPDIFSSIPDLEDPKDRIVQVTKWFLSAFHAGKKGSVAKKPYNPIIGETFQCFYDMTEPGTEYKEPKPEDIVTDGPVPWATKNQVGFLAEQVSHHPPISAFYAENYNKGVSVNAYIWTKSKFLGLSIGVEMIGQAVLSDLKHDEEYLLTFPNGYGRSILTVPWFEMGGKCSISCAKTGFASTVVFHTKPFYGGSRHRITSEVSHVSDRKPFLTITGEWNGVMTSKWANGNSETFIDTLTIKTHKKRVKPVDQQDEFESRRLWKDVTYNLKMKNMDSATAAKHKLEERQRSERKEREATGTKWITNNFYEEGDSFIYKRPLQKRLEEKLEQIQRDRELQLQQQQEEETQAATTAAATTQQPQIRSQTPPQVQILPPQIHPPTQPNVPSQPTSAAETPQSVPATVSAVDTTTPIPDSAQDQINDLLG